MSEHCEHCIDDTLLQYDGWDHHCFIDGAGYLHWDDGKCPLCAPAEAERDRIVAWLRAWAERNGEVDVSGEIERGAHIDGLREGGGATRSSLGNRPPHHLRGDDE